MKIYIEAGANDGIFQSCTYPLELTGEWIGILVEPDENVYNSCVRNRSSRNYFYNCALVSFQHKEATIPFYMHADYSAMGGVFKRRDTSYLNTTKDVPCRTLQSILDEVNIHEIDKMFLDVEGFEFDVLKGIDFTKSIIREVEVEIHSKSVAQFLDNEKEKDEIISLMNKNRYKILHINDPGHSNTKLTFTLTDI